MKRIIAIIGKAGSWKNLAWYFLSHTLWIPSYTISEALRITARERGIEESRENLIALWKEFSEKYGDEYLAKIIVERSNSDEIIIIGMRQVWQVEYCKNNYNTQCIWIQSNAKIRYQRLLKNNKTQETFENFFKVEKLDEWNIQNVSQCLKYCSVMIKNNTTIEDFFEKFNEII